MKLNETVICLAIRVNGLLNYLCGSREIHNWVLFNFRILQAYTHTIQMVFCVSTVDYIPVYILSFICVYIECVTWYRVAGKLFARMATPMAHTIITDIFIGIVIEFEQNHWNCGDCGLPYWLLKLWTSIAENTEWFECEFRFRILSNHDFHVDLDKSIRRLERNRNAKTLNKRLRMAKNKTQTSSVNCYKCM